MMFSELVKQAHATALEKGWHEGEDRSVNRAGALIALMHSEVVEATHATSHRTIEELSDPVACLAEELADVLIRLADAVGWFGWAVRDVDLSLPRSNMSGLDCGDSVHYALASFGTEVIRINGKPSQLIAAEVYGACLAWLRLSTQGDACAVLLSAIKAKLAKNKTRSFRHGGKLL
jgi:hypothetical protein